MPRILVVDDEPSVCQSISALLKRNGYEVTTADGAESGLLALAGNTFDLMIVDVFMPQMHGFEAVRIFHQRAPKVPMVAISGYAFAETERATPDFLSMAIELGAWRCLRKPFTSAALLFVVKECLNEARVADGVFSAGQLELRDP